MANQYKTALQHAADELSGALLKYNIVVSNHNIIHENRVQHVLPGTTRAECKKLLNQFIAENIQTRLIETQETLL